MATILIPQTKGIVTIDNTLNAKPGDTIVLQPGTYDALIIKGLVGTAISRITLLAKPGAIISHPSFTTSIESCSYLTLDGFTYNNQGGYGVEFRSLLHSVWFQNFTFTNSGSYAFTIASSFVQAWDGTQNTAFTDIQFQNISFTKCPAGSFFNFGYFTESDSKNVFLNPIFNNISFVACGTSAQVGEFIRILAYGYIVNRVSNIDSFLGATDTSGVGHNSLIYIRGYGDISNIRSVNDWGNMVRAYPSKTTYPGYNVGSLRIWNIIANNKRKYAPLSIEQISADTVVPPNPHVVKTDIKIDFVTVINLNPLDEQNNHSRAIDAYSSNITANNIVVCNPGGVFNPSLVLNYILEQKTGGLSNIIIKSKVKAYASDTNIIKDSANGDYTPISPDLVGAGDTVSYAPNDFNGNIRPSVPSIGAVDYILNPDPVPLPVPFPKVIKFITVTYQDDTIQVFNPA